MRKKIIIAALLLSSGLNINAATASDRKSDSYPVYLMGVEDFSGQDVSKLKALPDMPTTMVFGVEAASSKSGAKSSKKVISKTTNAENEESLKKTLESFQEAIKGLCVSEIELNLAFSVSAKAWVVVNGSVDASAKVVIKNPKQECK